MSRVDVALSCLVNLDVALAKHPDVRVGARTLRHWLELASWPTSAVSDEALESCWHSGWVAIWNELGILLPLPFKSPVATSSATDPGFELFEDTKAAILQLGGREIALADVEHIHTVASSYTAVGLQFRQTGDRFNVTTPQDVGPGSGMARILVQVRSVAGPQYFEGNAATLRLVA